MKTATLSAILFGSASALPPPPLSGASALPPPPLSGPTGAPYGITAIEEKKEAEKFKAKVPIYSLKCHPKDACNWNCKEWCDCTEKFPWIYAITADCGVEGEECDCDDPQIDFPDIDIPEIILKEPRKPFEWVDPHWDPIPDMWVDVTGAIVCGDWKPPFFQEYNDMLDQFKGYAVGDIKFQNHLDFLYSMKPPAEGTQTLGDLIAATKEFFNPQQTEMHFSRRLSEEEKTGEITPIQRMKYRMKLGNKLWRMVEECATDTETRGAFKKVLYDSVVNKEAKSDHNEGYAAHAVVNKAEAKSDHNEAAKTEEETEEKVIEEEANTDTVKILTSDDAHDTVTPDGCSNDADTATIEILHKDGWSYADVGKGFSSTKFSAKCAEAILKINTFKLNDAPAILTSDDAVVTQVSGQVVNGQVMGKTRAKSDDMIRDPAGINEMDLFTHETVASLKHEQQRPDHQDLVASQNILKSTLRQAITDHQDTSFVFEAGKENLMGLFESTKDFDDIELFDSIGRSNDIEILAPIKMGQVEPISFEPIKLPPGTDAVYAPLENGEEGLFEMGKDTYKIVHELDDSMNEYELTMNGNNLGSYKAGDVASFEHHQGEHDQGLKIFFG